MGCSGVLGGQIDVLAVCVMLWIAALVLKGIVGVVGFVRWLDCVALLDVLGRLARGRRLPSASISLLQVQAELLLIVNSCVFNLMLSQRSEMRLLSDFGDHLRCLGAILRAHVVAWLMLICILERRLLMPMMQHR